MLIYDWTPYSSSSPVYLADSTEAEFRRMKTDFDASRLRVSLGSVEVDCLVGHLSKRKTNAQGTIGYYFASTQSNVGIAIGLTIMEDRMSSLLA